MTNPIVKDLYVGDTTTVQLGYPTDAKWWPEVQCKVLAITRIDYNIRYIVRILDETINGVNGPPCMIKNRDIEKYPILLVSAVAAANLESTVVLEAMNSIGVHPKDEQSLSAADERLNFGTFYLRLKD